MVWHSHHDDGDFINLLRWQGARLVVHACRFEPTFEVREERRAFQLFATFGDFDLLGVFQVKRQMRSRWVALGRFRL